MSSHREIRRWHEKPDIAFAAGSSNVLAKATGLDLHRVTSLLKQRKHHAEVSRDAGRFLCNVRWLG